jgi:hypothetical protein
MVIWKTTELAGLKRGKFRVTPPKDGRISKISANCVEIHNKTV